MRFRAVLVLLALALAPWAPAADCAVPARPWTKAAKSPARACCCDEASGNCAMPDARAEQPATEQPAPAAADELPCCRATNAPVPAVPASALDVSAAPQPPVASATPESAIAATADDAARCVATTESPPGARPSPLETNRLRL